MKCCLYWVTTPDHDEDWFIFAKNRRSAECYHEEYEGYDKDTAEAQLVLRQVDGIDDLPCHTHIADLERLGARIISAKQPRVVEIQGKCFQEGTLDYNINSIHDDVFEAHGQGRPNETVGSPGRGEVN
jgi:hypothetical protein